ncbi:pyridoxamine 5'-phosphate oxidase family protein [Tenggerimyces flavus]|uniref:Pyridoxamine 5'-phosphate oxidase family protein n=1 Tax=Tenggerimyces flavus TaxID=1708749 RepID=A0ABV7Y6V3_9ACTN|nr:pyridoxamine 5'-phosphate oxidase family protein [Tenggerimyces flavus]MBM7784976.1 nitroimidazol reductase NimA-like FMN-containing flavoprotein (pyridoxamine 5'-phosphate oxidase superfamily) [Tenggerimyces flavus]
MTTDEPRARPLRAPSVYKFPSGTDGFVPWSHVEKRLFEATNYWLATVRPDGQPHVTPLWGVWVERALYFDGLPTTRWGRNLAANPRATAHLESADDVVILTGEVEDLEQTSAELGERITLAWSAKYGRLEPEPATQGIFRLRPRTVRAFTGSLDRGCAWQLV